MKKKVVSAICGVMLVVSATQIVNDVAQRNGESALFESITNEVYAAKKEIPKNDGEHISEEVVFDIYDALYEQNNDLVGWINIPNTNVNYPVMQTEENPEYYLRRDFEKNSSISGVPFIGVGCSLEPQTTNVIIYGHNMRNGTMFSDLISYKKESYYKENPTVIFDTLTESKEYEIMGAFVVDTEIGNGHLEFYNFIEPKNEEEFNTFVNEVKKSSYYDTGVSAEYGDKLLTLVTCEKTTTTAGRLVVVAVEKD